MHQVLEIALKVLLIVLEEVFLMATVVDCKEGIEKVAACLGAWDWSTISVGGCEGRLLHGW